MMRSPSAGDGGPEPGYLVIQWKYPQWRDRFGREVRIVPEPAFGLVQIRIVPDPLWASL